VSCNEGTDMCDTVPPAVNPCPDNLFCNDVSCNEGTDMCDTIPPAVNPCPDNLFCNDVQCNEGTDMCDTVPPAVNPCPDNDFCTNYSCNEGTDLCDPVDDSSKCNLDPAIPDVCEICNETTDQCEVDLSQDPSCTPQELICRTPGFWKTHAGTEKARSQNITGAVLTSVGGLTVCGEVINDTLVDSGHSVLEAMCVSPRGNQTLQLIRQLTAMGLNCAVSEIGGDCNGNMALGDLWTECNATCTGAPSSLSVGQCIGLIDCFNNGGVITDDGSCVSDENNNCHERSLPEEYNPPGPAGSTEACKAAQNTACLIGDC